jgi:hypothetical protein
MLLPAAGWGRPGSAEDGRTRVRRHAPAGLGHQPHAPAVQRAAPGAAAGRRVRGPHRGVVLCSRLLLRRRPPHPVGLLRQPRLHLGGARAPAPPALAAVWRAAGGVLWLSCASPGARGALQRVPKADPFSPRKCCCPPVGLSAVLVLLTGAGAGGRGRDGPCSSCGSSSKIVRETPVPARTDVPPVAYWRSAKVSARAGVPRHARERAPRR